MVRAVLTFILFLAAEVAFAQGPVTPDAPPGSPQMRQPNAPGQAAVSPAQARAKLPRRSPAQTQPGQPGYIPPPPGAPPADFQDDDTEFDDGDDLPSEAYPGRAAAAPPPGGQQNQGSVPAAPPPAFSGGGGTQRIAAGKIQFHVVPGEYWEKGKKRQRGKLEGE